MSGLTWESGDSSEGPGLCSPPGNTDRDPAAESQVSVHPSDSDRYQAPTQDIEEDKKIAVKDLGTGIYGNVHSSVVVHQDVVRFLKGDITYDEYMGGKPSVEDVDEDDSKDGEEAKNRPKSRKRKRDVMTYTKRRKKKKKGQTQGKESPVFDKEKATEKKNKKKLKPNDGIPLFDNPLSGCGWCGIRYTSAAHMDRHVDMCRGKNKSTQFTQNTESSESKDKLPSDEDDETEENECYFGEEIAERIATKENGTESKMVRLRRRSVKEREPVLFTCEICKHRRGPSVFTIYNKAKIILHYRRHTEEDLMGCEECVWVGQVATDYLDHVMGHHPEERPLGCAACGYRTGQPSALATHKLLHPHLRPWACPKCLYKSRSKRGLMKHLRIHYGRRMFRCPGCRVTSYLRAGLIRHLANHGTSPGPT